MKRLVCSLIILSALLFACTISTTATPSVPPTVPVGSEPTVTQPPVATQPPLSTDTPTATVPPLPQTNVTCNGVMLFLDPALASGFNCQSVPEAADTSMPPFAVNPQYTEITLQGYPLADRFMTPHIDFFPVDRYAQLLPDLLPAQVTALKSLIGGAAPGTGELPLLPIQNAAQQMHVQYHVIPFVNGSGTRFLTQYAQSFDPINNHDMFYTFQGLTGDGKYWISAILPVSNPSLPADGKNPPNGQSWDDFGNNFPKYMADMNIQLDSQTPESYSPSISALDALIASIKVQP